MSKNVIQDGYTRHGYIAAEDRLHDEMEFTYRPMYGGAAGYFSSQEFRVLDAAHQAAEEAKAVAKQLLSWSEVDSQGKPVPINTDNVFRLPSLVRTMMLNIISGYRASDLKAGEQLVGERDEEIERLLEAHQSKRSPGDVAAVADAKN